MKLTRRRTMIPLLLSLAVASSCRDGAIDSAAPIQAAPTLAAPILAEPSTAAPPAATEAHASQATAATGADIRTDEDLAAELIAMGQAEQDLRGLLIEQGARVEPALVDELSALDESNTQRLLEIVATRGWPTKALVGAEGANAAWLILQHSPDHEFQQRMLPELEHLMASGDVRGEEYALLFDRVQMFAGRPQRYGSQFKLNDGVMPMHACEDPAHLDERRASVGLGTIADYVRVLEEAYKLPVAPVVPVAPAVPADAP